MRQLFYFIGKNERISSMKKVELLAPAGNYEAFQYAIFAGADAVYLGGEKFGARAYADNFTQEQICRAIRMAHLFGRKVYLTVNTLVKERELEELYDFLLPFYQEGLDGVIVQDMGVVCYIRDYFPELPIHASTQMTITGSHGAKMLYDFGITRIVPARELSLEEMKTIKQESGVEVEAFIHGAMCYCYSGQCLFSSILGGRSGNRGRCAQPCRLPYRVDGKKENYPLSMKDMCMIHQIPKLIEAGIDSFKIEGRMKKPVYTAGVTAIYRKYIDRYYRGEFDKMEKEDEVLLRSLYIRSELSEGYYFKKNGKEMITLKSPSYSGMEEEVLTQIEERYKRKNMQMEVNAELDLHVGEKAKLRLQWKSVQIIVEGTVVQAALKQPLSKEKVTEQLQKTGDSFFVFPDVILNMDEAVFMPIRELNELRRMAIHELENQIIENHGLFYHREIPSIPQIDVEKRRRTDGSVFGQQLHVLVSTMEQLKAAQSMEKVTRIYLESRLLHEDSLVRRLDERSETEYYLATPYVIRKHNEGDLFRMEKYLNHKNIRGVLIRNLECFSYFQERNVLTNYVLDANLYCWNHESVAFWQEKADEFYLPIEENVHEWKDLIKHMDGGILASAIVYGRIPMMITANCVQNTSASCIRQSGITMLTDRYGKQFPVLRNCESCYNVIYNSVPLSLHGMFTAIPEGISAFRLDFTTEDHGEVMDRIRYFSQLMEGNYQNPLYSDFTTGHYKRGVE